MDDIELDFCIKNFKKTGDNLYFEKIYRLFFQKIYRFVLLNISDTQAAEGITIDVFYNVYRYLAKTNINSGNFRGWIYKIARNMIIDYYRKEAKHSQTQSLEHYMETMQSDDLDDFGKIDKSLIVNNPANSFMEKNFKNNVESEFANQDLLKALDCLPEIQKQVLILRFVEELDYKTISMIINKSEFTVRAIKFRAISKLKELMAK